jgi:hypothetical protein
MCKCEVSGKIMRLRKALTLISGQSTRSLFFENLRQELDRLADELQLKKTQVSVRASALSPEDALGSTKRKDFVLLQGKERLLQADILGCKGQAFTSAQGDFDGTLEDVLDMQLDDDFQRAVSVASLNAVACCAGKATNTIHCRDKGPELCARQVVGYFKENFGQPNILMIGYQPALAEALNPAFNLVVLDLDPANIGKTKNGVLINDGAADLSERLAACDVIFATGSIICNNTVDVFYRSGKPLIFYGSTAAGAAALLDLPRYCPESTAGK